MWNSSKQPGRRVGLAKLLPIARCGIAGRATMRTGPSMAGMRNGPLASMALFTKDSTAGRILAVLLGQVLPLLGSLLAFPLLYQGLGSDRFGYFMLAWTIAGYVGVLDLGVSRA